MATPDSQDPIELARRWSDEAVAAGALGADLAGVCTVDAAGVPSVRTVPIRRIGPNGVEFFTDSATQKARDMAERPDQIAVLLAWPAIGREVRLTGRAEFLGDDRAEVEFERRTRDEQIFSWAVAGGGMLGSSDELSRRVEQRRAQFERGDVPRPPSWKVVVVVPRTVEFFRVGERRAHERMRFTRETVGWTITRLVP